MAEAGAVRIRGDALVTATAIRTAKIPTAKCAQLKAVWLTVFPLYPECTSGAALPNDPPVSRQPKIDSVWHTSVTAVCIADALKYYYTVRVHVARHISATTPLLASWVHPESTFIAIDSSLKEEP
eukprot:CAMPEP_0183362132 /NCGR_PEP_ID=MMETSP0164_2-20130417/66902_1 /TAXON_ID=221442 /ORGANISM="Coccolithus pelagicus ssp braarudi, Strain PLY182g" /LENGTH=124 /DNA_ID=CAMNT_0025536913 /DNA_START=183 /DNA_END=554 /DNA_ORIENTATION=+